MSVTRFQSGNEAAQNLSAPAKVGRRSQTKGFMKVLLIGVGGVGEAIAAIAKERPWVEQIVLADYNQARAESMPPLKPITAFLNPFFLK